MVEAGDSETLKQARSRPDVGGVRFILGLLVGAPIPVLRIGVVLFASDVDAGPRAEEIAPHATYGEQIFAMHKGEVLLRNPRSAILENRVSF